MNKRDYTLYNWPKEMVRNGKEPEELYCFNICDTTYYVTGPSHHWRLFNPSLYLRNWTRNSRLGRYSGPQLKNELNRITGRLGFKENRIHSTLFQKHQGILIEVDKNEAASWLKVKDNHDAFCSTVGPNVIFKTQAYNLIVFNVALTLDPDNQRYQEEICEMNHLNKDMIIGM